MFRHHDDGVFAALVVAFGLILLEEVDLTVQNRIDSVIVAAAAVVVKVLYARYHEVDAILLRASLPARAVVGLAVCLGLTYAVIHEPACRRHPKGGAFWVEGTQGHCLVQAHPRLLPFLFLLPPLLLLLLRVVAPASLRLGTDYLPSASHSGLAKVWADPQLHSTALRRVYHRLVWAKG